MDISKANIDEHLFEYFEGTMHPVQQDALMQYIHQHPEFETDFVQWQKAYHHKSHALEDYGIAAKVKLRVPKPPLFSAYYLMVCVALGWGMGWFLNYYGKEPHYTSVMDRPHTVQVMPPTQGVPAAPAQPKSSAMVRFNQKDQLVLLHREDTAQQTFTEAPVPSPAPAPALTEAPEKYVEEVKTLSPTTDTLTQEKKIVKPIAKAPAVKKVPKKQKRKGIFSTTDKVLPVNDNF
ncbi:MAG TPA: hypothetical protein VL947_14380 [Cytophagales bacterium]|nr:hypothetical protein [Cytophagales bacterium]